MLPSLLSLFFPSHTPYPRLLLAFTPSLTPSPVFGCSVYLFPLELAPPLTFECTPAVACRALNTSVANISDVHLDWTYTSSSSATGTTVVNSTDRGVAVTHDGIEIARGATIQVAGSYTPLLNGTAFVAGQQIYSMWVGSYIVGGVMT